MTAVGGERLAQRREDDGPAALLRLQRGVAALGALRPADELMLLGRHRERVERQHVRGGRGHPGDEARGLERDEACAELDGQRHAARRGQGLAATQPPLQVRQRLPVRRQPVGEAAPAAGLARPEDGPDPDDGADGTREQPRRPRRQRGVVAAREGRLQVVVRHGHGQRRRLVRRRDSHAGLRQRVRQCGDVHVAVRLQVHGTRREVADGRVAVEAAELPVRRLLAVDLQARVRDTAGADERVDRPPHALGRVELRELGDDLLGRAGPVE